MVAKGGAPHSLVKRGNFIPDESEVLAGRLQLAVQLAVQLPVQLVVELFFIPRKYNNNSE